MADAKCCDRCGEFYKLTNDILKQSVDILGKDIGGIGIRPVNTNDFIKLDICPKCLKSLAQWFEETKPFDISDYTPNSKESIKTRRK